MFQSTWKKSTGLSESIALNSPLENETRTKPDPKPKTQTNLKTNEVYSHANAPKDLDKAHKIWLMANQRLQNFKEPQIGKKLSSKGLSLASNDPRIHNDNNRVDDFHNLMI